MFLRLLDAGYLRDSTYTAIDRTADSLAYARECIDGWARARDWSVEDVSAHKILLGSVSGRVQVEFVEAEIEAYLGANPDQRRWDLLIAHAVLDLLDVPVILPRLLSCLRLQGGFYFPINFDGVTIFEPVIDRFLDEEISRCYHQTMDERRATGAESGESRTGRRLFGQVALAGGHILEAGSSDWVVYPRAGSYPADEAYFLQSIIRFMESALTGHPDLDPKQLGRWISRRREQVDAGELTFIAHQIDLFGLR
jgi:hypothetical protein